MLIHVSQSHVVFVCLHKSYAPVDEQQQGEATKPLGQGAGCVQVQVLGGWAREQEDLGGLLVGKLGGLDHRGVIIHFRL